MKYETFRNHFRYRRELAGNVGVEREFHIKDEHGAIVPRAYEVLEALKQGIPTPNSDTARVLKPDADAFGYELSACQIETRVGPVVLHNLKKALTWRNAELVIALNAFRLRMSCEEVAPETMPLNVYPDPSGRYQRITKEMPRAVLLAACRVIGTHVHIGMPDHETALRVYNALCRHFAMLCELGNGSFGERLAIYRQMAPGYVPLPYEGWDHFYERATKEGFVDDPRKCWTMIRISVHGTIEFRMFGATDSVDRIVLWAARCHELCMNALAQAS